jgi:GT2 family glycosyltransferase
LGGFDEEDFGRVIEDIELGYRLRRHGHRIPWTRPCWGRT